MPAYPGCPAEDHWRGYLAGALPETDQESLTVHLDTCPGCQQTLDTLASGTDSLPGIARAVGRAVNPGDATLLTPPAPPDPAGTDPDHAETRVPAAPPGTHPYLTPSPEAGSPGRLAHYEILEEVGRGGMGRVLKARDTKLQRVVAVKLLAPELAASETARKRFVREARAAAAVRDEHVVQTYAVEDAGPIPYLVMEFIDGITLEEKLRRDGPVPVGEILRVGSQAARGLAAAHRQGLIHRDIKPGNILLENGVRRVKITDFGLARAVDDASVTASGVIAGTPMYMSPEQARGDPVDHRSDLFSLGSVLYALCTGRPPFRAETTMGVLKRVCDDTPRPIPELVPGTPGWLCDIVSKLLAKNADDRFQTATEVADLLAACLVKPPEPAPPLPTPPRRTRRPLALAAVVCLAAGAVGIYSLTRPDTRGNSPNAGKGGPPAPEPDPPSRTPAPNPLDALQREDIPPDLLAVAGGGDPGHVPPELVAVLGDSGFRYVGTRTGAVRPDGTVFAGAVSGDAGWVVVWDLATGKPVASPWLAHPRFLTALAYSPDGRRLATASVDGSVAVWDAESRVRLRSYQVGTTANEFVGRLEFSGDGNWLAAGWTRNARDPHEGWVRIWDARTLEEARTFAATTPGVTADLHAMAFTPDGTRLTVGTITGEVRVWDPATGKEIGKSRWMPGRAGAYVLAFDPGGERFAVGSGAGSLFLWEDGKAQPAELAPEKGLVFSLAYSRNGKWLAWGTADGLVRVRNQETKQTGTVLSCGKEIRYLAFTPDGKNLITGGVEDPLAPRVWDLEAGKERGLFQLPNRARDPAPAVQMDQVCCAAFNREGTLLASGTRNGLVHVWDLSTQKARHSLEAGAVTAVAFSPDGKTLAAACEPDVVELWDVSTGKPKATLRGHTRAPLGLAFSPDGKWLASGGQDRTVRLWPLDGGRRERTFGGFTDAVTGVAFSPDGATLAAVSRDGTVRRWPVAGGDELAVLKNTDGTPVRCLAYRPGGKTLVTGDEAHRISEWDLAQLQVTQTARHDPPGDAGGISGLAWTEDGTRLASGGWDGTVRLWDWTSTPPRGRKWTVPAGQGNLPPGIALSPDGRYLAVPTGKLVQILRVVPRGEVVP